jgi:hypothetical protein
MPKHALSKCTPKSILIPVIQIATDKKMKYFIFPTAITYTALQIGFRLIKGLKLNPLKPTNQFCGCYF